MTSVDSNELLRRKNDVLQAMHSHIEILRSFKDIRLTTWPLALRNDFTFVANTNVLLNNLTDAKKFYYKSALLTCEVFKIFDEKKFPNLEKKESLPFTSQFVNSLLDVILCDSEILQHELARIIKPQEEPPIGLRFNYEITLAIKHLLLREMNKAKEHAMNAHQENYFKLPYNGFSHIVLGILEENSELINSGIRHRINYHIKNQKGSIFFNVSFEATALAKLAQGFNLDIDTSSTFINKGLLAKDSINYEGVNDLLDALSDANRRNGGFFDRLKGILK